LKMKIATWNVRTLLDLVGNNRPERRTALVAAELDRYGIEVAALQETRFSGSGQLKEKTHTIFWSGRPEGERRDAGVAFAISNAVMCKLSAEPIAVSDRLITLRAELGVGRYAMFVCAYAPTLYSSEEDKYRFYHSLEEVLSNVSSSDKLIILGDFNARVGTDHHTWDRVLGRFGHGKMNENGTLLAMKCVEHELAIANTYFRLPEKWYGSWKHPRSKHVHLLDYVITRRSSISDVLNCRVFRGAECGTDHYMVRAVVNFTFCKVRTGFQRQPPKKKLNVTKLSSVALRSRLEDNLTERLANNNNDVYLNQTVEEMWKRLKTEIYETALETLGTSERKIPDWFAENEEEIRQLLSRKNSAYAATLAGRTTRRLHSSFRESRRILQRRLRELKDEWWRNKASELQEYADRKDYKNFYAGLREVYGPYVPQSVPVFSADGGTLFSEAEDISYRWREYYDSLLNCESNVDPSALDELPQQPIHDVLVPQPQLEEVICAIAGLQSGKAPGKDGIAPEVLKFGGLLLAEQITNLFARCWNERILPQEFRDAKIVSIYKKKGCKRQCGNYRGISLLSVPGKVLASVMLKRLLAAVGGLLPESQCGFRQGRGTTDMIFTLRQLQEKAIEQRKPLYIVFIDFRKAFDTVDRETLWRVLTVFGCPNVFVDVLRQFHDGMEATVVTGSRETASFAVRNGVRQGCVLAPTLFSLFLTAVLTVAELNDVPGISIVSRTDGKLFNLARLKARTKVQHLTVRELLYADDAAFVAESLDDLKEMTRRFALASQRFGLQINTDKTVVMHQPSPGSPYVIPHVRVGGVVLEDVSTFTYLGSAVTNSNSVDTEIVRRIQAASAAFGRLRAKVWSRHSLRLDTKLALYRAVVLPSMLYALETTTLYRRHIRKLTSVQIWQLRQLLNIKWHNYVPNVEVLQRANMPSVEALLTAANLRWAGHVVRMDDERLPKSVFYGELSEGTRTVGGQKLRFKDVLKRNLKASNVSVDLWEELAEDRMNYRVMCSDAVQRVENNRLEVYESARRRRHEIPTLAGGALQCPHCDRLCRGRVGLSAHMRARHRPIV